MRRYFLSSLCTVIFLISEAQTVLNVATQRFEKEVAYRPGRVLSLELEKAHVSVTGWDKNHYAFEILLNSKHKDPDQAVKELGYLKYDLHTDGDTVHFSNDFVSGEAFQKIQGMLNIELIIKAPESSQITITNAYGSTQVSNMSGPVSLKGKFVDTQVNSCQSELSLIAVFGSNKITDQSGDLFIDLSRVDLTGNLINGKVKGQASYGTIHLMRLSSPEVDIEARRTAFTLELDTPIEHYSYDLSTDLGNIFLEGSMDLKKSSKWVSKGTSGAEIRITTTLSPIVIRDKTLNAHKE